MECEVCFENFNETVRRPKVLGCGHTLCLRCVSTTGRCHVDRQEVPDVSALADNFYVLSCVDGSRKHSRKFYCLTCRDVAESDCEEEHDICSLKKTRNGQVNMDLDSVRGGVEMQGLVVARLVELLPLVAETFQRLVEAATDQQDQLQHAADRVQGVMETSGNQASWLDAVDALQVAAKQCAERKATLERQLQLLEPAGACRLQLEMERHGGGTLAANMDLSVDGEVSRATRFLLYLLSYTGNLDIPPEDSEVFDEEQGSRTAENGRLQDSDSDYDGYENTFEDAVEEGAACRELTEERRPGRPAIRGSRGSSTGTSTGTPRRTMVAARRLAARRQRERAQAYELMVTLDEQEVVPSMQSFECRVCLVQILPGDGVTLKNCLHEFCRDCLRYTIQHSEEAEVRCPYKDQDYSCESVLTAREIKALVPADVYLQHENRSLQVAESTMDNTYHCKTPDCTGWCQFEVGVNQFVCPVCSRQNCLQCQAFHEDEDCATYQDRIKRLAATDEEARATQAHLDAQLAAGDAMRCPKCSVIITKRSGCDALLCAMCKTDICWATKQARWGPKGRGDNSGGCKCNVNNRKCHPNCRNCH